MRWRLAALRARLTKGHQHAMTTPALFYPDVSSHKHGLKLAGAAAVCAKATEGTTFTDPDYVTFKDQAVRTGAFFFAFHFLHHGNAAAQAEHAFAVVGPRTGLMVDVEQTGGSQPGIGDETAFVDRYRQLGGICWLDYLPRWYWQKTGSPSLKPLADRGLLLVSSSYPAGGYSGDGPGWQPYGGRTPVVWQYTDKQPFGGQLVDFNAYKGSLEQLKSLVLTGKLPPAGPFRHVIPAGNTQTWPQLVKSRNAEEDKLAAVTRAKLSAVNLAVFDTFLAHDLACKAAGLARPAMTPGMVYWTVNK